MTPRYHCQLDRFSLDLEVLEDRFERALVRYEYPFKDGADLDDMGLKARVVSARCHFFGEARDTHLDFVDHLQIQHGVTLEFIHPSYGTIFGKVESFSVNYDDTEDVKVDFVFVEQIQSPVTPLFEPQIVTDVEAAYASGVAGLMQSFVDGLQDSLGAEGLSIAAQTLSDGPALTQLQGLSAAGRQLVGEIDAAVSTAEGLLNDIANPANTVISMVDFGTGLPGRVLGAVANLTERYALSISTSAAAPSQFAESFKSGLSDLADSVESLIPYIQASGALYGCAVLSGLYQTDEANRQACKGQESAPAFDASGNYLRRVTIPEIASIDELESSLAHMRETLQTAVNDFRENDSFKTIAQLLLHHVNIIKIDRERVVAVDVFPAVPLHLLCVRQGLPYTYADRILAINPQIRNPNEVSGTVRVYAAG